MKRFFLLFFALLPVVSIAQPIIPETYSSGYERSLRGGGFQYHSPLPDVTTSLLLRSIDSLQFIEWETEAVHHPENQRNISFIWMFGIDANTDSHRFKLSLNGTPLLSFSNPLVSEMKMMRYEGIDGSELIFRPVMIDKYGDPMGIAILTVPVTLVKKGVAQRLKIMGESAGSRSWYMTYEHGLRESVSINAVPAIIRGEKENYLPFSMKIVHLGEKTMGTVTIPGLFNKPFDLEIGFNDISILLPENTSPGPLTAIVTINGKPSDTIGFTVSQFPHFTVFLVQHTHTDIGYTRPQTEILPDHLRYIDYALDFCDQTDTLPDAARFRWTCETTWAVREYLKCRPREQIERLKKRVGEGRIEIAGLFLNGSDLSDETMIAAMLEPVKFIRDAGFPVKAAMQSDINGVPWALAEYLPDGGIQYLNMAQNTHRALKPFDRPTVFWWESPSGNRLMVNRPEHYMWANNLGILSRIETFSNALLRHLQDIVVKGYNFDAYSIQFSGYLTDNSPPSTTACKLVEEWNARYIWPKLRLSTLSDYLDRVKEKHGDSLPVIRGAWPDWWMDGFGSAAIQTAYARKAHSDFIANLGLATIATIAGQHSTPSMNDLLSQITDDIAFYDEHTFGAAESITDPLCENSVVQLGQKESYVWSAVKKNFLYREAVMGRLQPLLPKRKSPSLVLFNPSGIERNGSMMVYIDHQMLPKDKKFTLTDPAGQVLPMQPVSTREEGTWWMAGLKNLPPMGYRIFDIAAGDAPRELPVQEISTGIFQNHYYQITFDQSDGSVTGIFDKEWGRELIDSLADYHVGEVINERLGRNRGQLEQYRLEEYQRQRWSDVRFSSITRGAVFDFMMMDGVIKECAEGRITCEIRLYHGEKRIEFLYSMKKLAVTDPEGVYVAFPLKLDGGSFLVQLAGGTMVPGMEQIEGSASDWIGIQDFVSLRSSQGQIVMVSPEVPLVQLGEINLGKFARKANPATGHIFSWVMNNYWTTNFLASQEGELKWSYHITSGNNASIAKATNFAAGIRIPVLPRVLPGSPAEAEGELKQLYIATGRENVAIINVKPSQDGQSILFQLKETEGRSDSIALYAPYLSSITLTDAVRPLKIEELAATGEERDVLFTLGQPLLVMGKWLSFKPFETKFIKMYLSKE